MLDFIVILLIAYTISTPFMFFKAIKYGVKLASEPEKAAEEPIFHVPSQKKKPVMTAEEDRRAQILQNINNYNGSSTGQRKVEVKHD